MQMDWNKYVGRTINITMVENYGIVYNTQKNNDQPFYEIVFKTGKLDNVFDDGLLLEAVREKQLMLVYVPFTSIKCVEIF
ncbi:MAG: hypothetical protein K9J16_03945 [Melioribacteraceae bacterium]|nr:hypothetical protein [Melioribacteraceae bacterium]MCF8355632.1 hypothetical protein [Melioribacteraceae bacterium]MCF8394668.1 hypothetical protein [Melioribacteraceae bacterium]MCF8417998.1 hypothetical protein [Melioribacteraceae bacterium]